MIIMDLKPALTIQDQISLLRKRGINVDDEPFAKNFLLNNQYYRLNIYFHNLMDSPDHFPVGTKFSTLVDIYNNDKWMRNKLHAALEPIEIRIRTLTAYHLGIKYGSGAFYNKTLFSKEEYWQEISLNFKKEIERNRTDPV